jgi:hypothetical protein
MLIRRDESFSYLQCIKYIQHEDFEHHTFNRIEKFSSSHIYQIKTISYFK